MTEPGEADRLASRILAIVNQKGGVGKTTTAINLGTALAEIGFKCLLVDIDPQGNASTGLGSEGAERKASTYDVLAGDATLQETIVSTPIRNLRLAPASVDLSGVDVELVEDGDRASRLRRLLAQERLRDSYDYILIDCPPSLNLLTVNAMAAADEVIVPLQCEFFALEGLSQLLATVKRVQRGLNTRLRINGIVLTMFDQRNRLSSQVAEDVRQTLGAVVYETMIPRNVRLSEAPSHGVPALVYDANCAGSRAYRALAGELLERSGRTEAA